MWLCYKINIWTPNHAKIVFLLLHVRILYFVFLCSDIFNDFIFNYIFSIIANSKHLMFSPFSQMKQWRMHLHKHNDVIT